MGAWRCAGQVVAGSVEEAPSALAKGGSVVRGLGGSVEGGPGVADWDVEVEGAHAVGDQHQGVLEEEILAVRFCSERSEQCGFRG